MGFFSQLCEGCEHPALSVYATNTINDWMQHVVVILPNGSIIKGDYDGYGRVDGFEDVVGFDNTVWHLACWKQYGSPTDYRGESGFAPDQGYFFDTEHDMEEPR
jgi:hypothetical protein